MFSSLNRCLRLCSVFKCDGCDYGCNPLDGCRCYSHSVDMVLVSLDNVLSFDMERAEGHEIVIASIYLGLLNSV